MCDSEGVVMQDLLCEYVYTYTQGELLQHRPPSGGGA